MSIPKRVSDRIQSRLKSFQSILAAQKARDVSEADTVTVVKDLLSDIFGFDKYAEVTSEHAIRGTYCDLATTIDGKIAFMLEVKAIGIELKESHVKQAIDYASNQGCEWVVLTNGIQWRLYHVIFKKPIDKQEVACIDLTTINHRNEADLETLYILTREGFSKSAMADYRDKKDATSRYMLAAIILCSDAVQNTIRREVRRVSDLSIDAATIEKMLRAEVIKREAIEGELADAAKRRVCRAAASEKVLRKVVDAPPQTAEPTPVPAEAASTAE